MPDEPEEELPPIGNWEFMDRIPSQGEVMTLLRSLPSVWGVKTEDFADYVVVLPSNKKIKVENERGQKVDEYHAVATLYMSVAGRLKMLAAAAEIHDWSVFFIPEPTTPTGVPGMLQMDDRIVYREYCEIRTNEHVLGSKPGTAWVPSKGGAQAAGSNPYEKCESSARGRAIAAWGFGVLPGSGVASYEEMAGLSANRAALQDDEPSGAGRRSRGDLMQEILTTVEAIRQIREIDQYEMHAKVVEYAKRSFNLEVGDESVDPTGAKVLDIEWRKLKDGQMALLLNQMKSTLRGLVDAQAAV